MKKSLAYFLWGFLFVGITLSFTGCIKQANPIHPPVAPNTVVKIPANGLSVLADPNYAQQMHSTFSWVAEALYESRVVEIKIMDVTVNLFGQEREAYRVTCANQRSCYMTIVDGNVLINESEGSPDYKFLINYTVGGQQKIAVGNSLEHSRPISALAAEAETVVNNLLAANQNQDRTLTFSHVGIVDHRYVWIYAVHRQNANTNLSEGFIALDSIGEYIYYRDSQNNFYCKLNQDGQNYQIGDRVSHDENVQF